MNTLQYASYSSLAFICWEILITTQNEVELMWANIRKFSAIKILYFFTRYFGLAVQINAVVSAMLQARYPLPRATCRLWLTYQTASINLLLSAVDVILMIRVYAFYNRRRWVGMLMVILLAIKTVLNSVGAVLHIPERNFSASCLHATMPSSVMYYFIGGECIIQVTIFVLTIFKHFVAVRAGWGRTPLVSLVRRDGTTAFAVIIAILIGTSVYAKVANLHESAHIVFPAFTSILSCVGCRLIISMQKLGVPDSRPRGHSSHAMEQFTTIIESV